MPAGLRVAGRKVDALWRSPDANQPLLRKEFATEPGKTVERPASTPRPTASTSCSSTASRSATSHLAPGWTDYNKRIQAQTYDVTDQVQSGDNAFGAELGDGWWAGKVGMWGPGMYGDHARR